MSKVTCKSMGFNPSKTTFYQNGQKKVFSPQGPIYDFGSSKSTRRPNPIATYGNSATTAARFFIGLSVGATQVFTLDDVVSFFKEALGECGRKDSSYLLQKGVYEYDASSARVTEYSQRRKVVNPITGKPISYNTVPKNERVVVENSVQVIVLDLCHYDEQTSQEARIRIFANNCLRIAEEAAAKFLQDSVIVDIQAGGKTVLIAAGLPPDSEADSVELALDKLTCHLLGLDEKNPNSFKSVEYSEVLRQVLEQYKITVAESTRYDQPLTQEEIVDNKKFAISFPDIPENLIKQQKEYLANIQSMRA